MFMRQQPIRRFKITPYFYDPEKENEENAGIKFRRILHSPRPGKKPVRRWLILVIGLLFFIWYFQNMQKPQKIQVENITIEDITPQGRD